MVMCMRGKRLYLVHYFISLEGEIIHLSIWGLWLREAQDFEKNLEA